MLQRRRDGRGASTTTTTHTPDGGIQPRGTITWKRKRRANPVFYSQWYLGYDHNVVSAPEEDYDRWITGLCPTQYKKLLAEENAAIESEAHAEHAVAPHEVPDDLPVYRRGD